MREEQDQRPKIVCEGIPLDNVAIFKYLDTLFAADGQQIYDSSARIAQVFFASIWSKRSARDVSDGWVICSGLAKTA